MLTYHNDPQLKELLVREQRAHLEADQFLQCTYEQENGIFRGCAVGCAIESLQRAGKIGRDISRDNHAALATAVAWPEWLWHLADTLFEGLPASEAGKFAVDISEAVPVGMNVENVRHDFLSFVLREVLQFDRAQFADVATAVDRCADLHDSRCADPKQWAYAAARAARAARAADAAAYAAAYAAARVARAAARVVADVAADAAACAAADAAARVAYAAYAAARVAADAAARAADAAAVAARAAAYQSMAAKLLTLLRETNNQES